MERELAELIAKIQDQDAQVDYVSFLSMFTRPHETYRTGNNMRRLLAGQKPKDAIADTSPPLILAAQPPSGLPGVKAQLQKQVGCMIMQSVNLLFRIARSQVLLGTRLSSPRLKLKKDVL